MKPTKPPVRRVPSDDYEVTFGDKTYHPHAGEWVEFSGGPSWQFLRDSAELTQLRRPDGATQVKDIDQGKLMSIIDRLMEHLASRLVAWNWTDGTGTPLPPPTAEVVARLDQDEAQYLLFAVSSSLTDKESEKNA